MEGTPAAKAGVDAHDEDVVHHGKDFNQGLDRRGGVDDDGRQHVVLGDVLEGAMEMAADFLLDGDQVGAGSGEGGDEGVRVLDHQVAVERKLGDGAERFDHRGAKGDVGDEVAVHHVDVEDGGAATSGCGNVVGEVGKVRGEDGGCEFDHGAGH